MGAGVTGRERKFRMGKSVSPSSCCSTLVFKHGPNLPMVIVAGFLCSMVKGRHNYFIFLALFLLGTLLLGYINGMNFTCLLFFAINCVGMNCFYID